MSTTLPARRVALDITPSCLMARRYGHDYLLQCLWMRLDGLTVEQIADALACPERLITLALAYWQDAIGQRATRRGDRFLPVARNARRWKNRPAASKLVLTAQHDLSEKPIFREKI